MKKAIHILFPILLSHIAGFSQKQSAGVSIEPLIVHKLFHDWDHALGYSLNAFYQQNLFRNFYLRTGFQYESYTDYKINAIYPDCVSCSYPFILKEQYAGIGVPILIYIDFNYYNHKDPITRSYFFAGYEASFFLPVEYVITEDGVISHYDSEFPYDLNDKLINSFIIGLNFAPRLGERISLEFAPVYKNTFIDPVKSISINSFGLTIGAKYKIK
jgi:hypothetical protein